MAFGSLVSALSPLPVLGERDIPRRRFGAVTWGLDGRATTSSTDDVIRGSVDPGPGRSTKADKQTRTSETLWIITNETLRTADNQEGLPADHLQLSNPDGSGLHWYEVMSGDFYETILPHQTYKVMRRKESP